MFANDRFLVAFLVDTCIMSVKVIFWWINMSVVWRNKIIFALFSIVAIIFLTDAVKAFWNSNIMDVLKFLLFSLAIEIVGVLYLVPVTNKKAGKK